MRRRYGYGSRTRAWAATRDLALKRFVGNRPKSFTWHELDGRVDGDYAIGFELGGAAVALSVDEVARQAEAPDGPTSTRERLARPQTKTASQDPSGLSHKNKLIVQ